MAHSDFAESFYADYNQRVKDFRELEFEITFGQGNPKSSYKAFALLSDMETCYAARAYYACLVLALAAIEAYLKTQFGDRNLYGNLEKSGYVHELDWLRKLRNAIVHEDDTESVKYLPRPEEQQILDDYCKRAFKFVHTIFYQPVKS